tara:strand:- start:1270 stop:1530 length:261 start_codon:yes stop_codon:yes gene_type:complete
MDQNNLQDAFSKLEEKTSLLEEQIKDLQNQQLEISNNIITLIQHAETMNNVTDASGLLAEHVTELELKLNKLMSLIQTEIKPEDLN